MSGDINSPENTNVYYEVMEACVNMSNALTYSEETMAQYANILAGILDNVYSEADSVLAEDAKKVSEAAGDDSQAGYQEEYSADSSFYQNLETQWNSMVDSANTTVNNLANGQTQLTQFGSTMNGDAQYMSNEVSSALS